MKPLTPADRAILAGRYSDPRLGGLRERMTPDRGVSLRGGGTVYTLRAVGDDMESLVDAPGVICRLLNELARAELLCAAAKVTETVLSTEAKS